MMINNCTYQIHNKFTYQKITNNPQKTSFKGSFFSLLRPITFNVDKVSPFKTGVSDLGKIFPGTFGTQSTNSRPLPNFTYILNSIPELKDKGLSTNTMKYGNVFLKAKADIPLSTSGVEDCSVIYLLNEKTNTHSLFHAFSMLLEEDLNCINKLMPENFTHAILIPGKNVFWQVHETNINKLFNFVKKHNPNTIINLNHYSSRIPEIVGYKGQAFEIPINHILTYGKDKTQASFPILNLNICIFEDLKYCLNLQKLKKFKNQFKKYPHEIQEILLRELNKREIYLTKIQKS